MNNVASFDTAKVRKYLDQAVDGFLSDPPDTDFQRGWCAAIVVLYKECLGNMNDERLRICEDMAGALPCRNQTSADYKPRDGGEQ